MIARTTILTVAAFLVFSWIPVYGGEPAKSASPAPAVSDPRHISNGWNIPSEGYADQPYIAKTDDGAWLCVMTTGVGAEGAGGQHVVSMRSTDQGRTWDKIVRSRPFCAREASFGKSIVSYWPVSSQLQGSELKVSIIERHRPPE